MPFVILIFRLAWPENLEKNIVGFHNSSYVLSGIELSLLSQITVYGGTLGHTHLSY